MKAVDYIRKGWTQNKFAADAEGQHVEPTSPTAVCWCLYGALGAAYPNETEYETAYTKLVMSMGIYDIADWNDAKERTQQEVIDALEKAGV